MFNWKSNQRWFWNGIEYIYTFASFNFQKRLQNLFALLLNFLWEGHFILVYRFHIHYTFAGTIEFKNRGYKMSLDVKDGYALGYEDLGP